MNRPNLILLTVECWRGDHFGALTPNLVALGAESTVFANAQASGGWTLPAMTALMTSTYASQCGGSGRGLRSPHRKPVAEILLDAGYWTAGFTANPTCGGMAGFHRGFADFRDVARKPPALPDEAWPHRQDWRQLARMGIRPGAVETIADAAQLTDVALDWVDAHERETPWFLWVHYTDSHWPYLGGDGDESREELFELWRDREIFNTEVAPARGAYAASDEVKLRWTGRYGEALRITDREVGRLLGRLRGREDWARTMVVVAGDHGEEFGEHGRWQHQWNGLYQEGIAVPLMVRVPGAAPRVEERLVSHLDIAPTLLGWAGVARPGLMRGVDLAARDFGAANSAGRPAMTEMMGFGTSYRLAIRDGGWKYIYDIEDRFGSKLFNLGEDPGETRDVREAHPEVFRRFEEMRFAQVGLGLVKLLRREDVVVRSPDESVREQLAALGYL